MRARFGLRTDADAYEVVEHPGEALPPALILFAELLDHLGVVGGQVVLLAGVGLDVVKLLAVDEPPPIGHHRALEPLFGILDSLRVDQQCSVAKRFGIAAQQRRQARAVDLGSLGLLHSAKVGQRRQHVDVGRQLVDVASAADLSGRPTDEQRHSMSAVVLGALAASHPGVKAIPTAGFRRLCVPAGRRAVVGHEDQYGVFFQARLLESTHQLAEIFVDVGDHAVELRHRVGHALVGIRLGIFFVDQVRPVRRVGGKVNEERPILVLVDELQGVVEPDVGAVAGNLLGLAVAEVDVVEVVVTPVVGPLTDAAPAVAEDVVETLVLRAVRVVIAQVPFAEHAGAVAGRLEHLGHRDFVGAHQRAAHDRVPHAGASGVAARHQRTTAGRAGGVDVEVGEPNALAVELVHVGRLDHRVSVSGQVAVALVVGNHQDNVGAGRRRLGRCEVGCDDRGHDRQNRHE